MPFYPASLICSIFYRPNTNNVNKTDIFGRQEAVALRDDRIKNVLDKNLNDFDSTPLVPAEMQVGFARFLFNLFSY